MRASRAFSRAASHDIRASSAFMAVCCARLRCMVSARNAPPIPKTMTMMMTVINSALPRSPFFFFSFISTPLDLSSRSSVLVVYGVPLRTAPFGVRQALSDHEGGPHVVERSVPRRNPDKAPVLGVEDGLGDLDSVHVEAPEQPVGDRVVVHRAVEPSVGRDR